MIAHPNPAYKAGPAGCAPGHKYAEFLPGCATIPAIKISNLFKLIRLARTSGSRYFGKVPIKL
jgi:hypothetical protein